MNSNQAKYLLKCAGSLQKQAEPSPYEQMTPPYMQNAISSVGRKLRKLRKAVPNALTNHGRAKPSLLGAFGIANALKSGLGDHTGLTTLLSPNPMANLARVGGNYARGIGGALKNKGDGQTLFGSGTADTPTSPALSPRNIWNNAFGNRENPKGWQQLTGIPHAPSQMVNMGDSRLRQLASQEFNNVLEHGPTAEEVSQRAEVLNNADGMASPPTSRDGGR
jgi:hypothetical protein